MLNDLKERIEVQAQPMKRKITEEENKMIESKIVEDFDPTIRQPE